MTRRAARARPRHRPRLSYVVGLRRGSTPRRSQASEEPTKTLTASPRGAAGIFVIELRMEAGVAAALLIVIIAAVAIDVVALPGFALGCARRFGKLTQPRPSLDGYANVHQPGPH